MSAMNEKENSTQPSGMFRQNTKIVSLIARIDQLQTSMVGAEMRFVQSAVESRKKEFAAGRNIARQCLAEFGHGNATIAVLDSRAPAWPSEIAGSISHSSDFVGAATCLKSNYRAIGLDLEECGAVTADLFDSILTKDDLTDAEAARDSSFATLIFCCKESVYKAVNPLTSEFLSFTNVSIQIDGNHFRAKCDPDKVASQLIAAGHGFLEIKDGFVRALFLIK